MTEQPTNPAQTPDLEQGRPTGERRERYAAAIQQRVVPGYTLTIILPEVYQAADAAMAVAAAEQAAAVRRALDDAAKDQNFAITRALESTADLLAQTGHPAAAVLVRPLAAAVAAPAREQGEAQQPTPCGPIPDQCDAEAGDPCADHERQQAHAEGEHAFCGPECPADGQGEGEARQPEAAIRAKAFHDAADFMRDAHFRDGMSVQEIGTALRLDADALAQQPAPDA